MTHGPAMTAPARSHTQRAGAGVATVEHGVHSLERMIQIVYCSEASEDFSPQQLVALLEKSRANNRVRGLSGMLLYRAGRFLQVLEGDATHVRALVARIGKDARHHGIVLLSETQIESREFPDWSMGFADLSAVATDGLPGFTHFLESNLSATSFARQIPAAKRLLLAFKDQAAQAA